mgnify:CR=1 FL=1
MRERELKPGEEEADLAVGLVSLPMRERELKLALWPLWAGRQLSLPMRERELKHGGGDLSTAWGCRSPCGSVN